MPESPEPSCDASPAAAPSGGDSLLKVLHEVFGFGSFRDNQEGIVRAILSGRDVFAVMPTGGGKSLCYQLPACVLEGVALIVSPLISLMKDQVDAARENGMRAAFWNSTLTNAQRSEVAVALQNDELDLLYVSPERLGIEGFLDLLKSVRISLIAIDEAHCISEWGHDFRPDYLELAALVQHFPDVPVAAFTATATHKVQQDILARLGLRDPHLVRASFNRPNLFYQVQRKEDVESQLLELLRPRAGQASIVYRTTRKNVDETAAYLQQAGIKALPYHAGLDPALRQENQEAFNRDECDVIVATIAFGMGIDKSNVRTVIHADLPKTVEGYYQETGRAGRDGAVSHCILLFGLGDLPTLRFFINQMEDQTERKAASFRLARMVDLGQLYACRRKQLLAYFDETYPGDNCGACDVCCGQATPTDCTVDAQKLMSAVVRTGERFGCGYVIDVVCGADTQKIRDLGHDQLPTYGVGKDLPKTHWRLVLDNLMAQQCLTQSDTQYPTLSLTRKGREVLFGRQRFVMLRPETKAAAPRLPKGKAAGEGSYDEALFEQLRGLRRRIAAREGVPPYIVFSDRTLQEMARSRPQSLDEMGMISGVGQTKLHKYGQPFLDAVTSHSGGGAPSKSQTAEATWALLREGKLPCEIAATRGLSESTIVGHIEVLLKQGKSVNLSSVVDEATAAEIRALFDQHGTASLGKIIEAGEGKYSYAQARLVRATLQTPQGPV